MSESRLAVTIITRLNDNKVLDDSGDHDALRGLKSDDLKDNEGNFNFAEVVKTFAWS